jgi:hypothetical protein
MMSPRPTGRAAAIALLSIALLLGAAAPAFPQAPPVEVVVDMDAATAGVQSAIHVPAGTTQVGGIAVTLRDPLGTRPLLAIGFIGGIDRGLAFGHVPFPANAGAVTALVAHPGLPAHPLNTILLESEPVIQEAFPGPEVQYIEFGAAEPAPIPAHPAAPLFTVDVTLTGAAAGDVFAFHLFDLVAVWAGNPGERGAFSTTSFLSLDTGGDVRADSTVSLYGTDSDLPVPVPPAAYAVDLVDGGSAPGPARIVVGNVAGAAGDGAAPAARVRLLPPAPNPARGGAAIRLEVRAPLVVEIAVHDAGGRLVRVLAAGAPLAAGLQIVPFDGKDAAGRPLAAGTYFVTLAAGNTRQSERVVLLK